MLRRRGAAYTRSLVRKLQRWQCSLFPDLSRRQIGGANMCCTIPRQRPKYSTPPASEGGEDDRDQNPTDRLIALSVPVG